MNEYGEKMLVEMGKMRFNTLIEKQKDIALSIEGLEAQLQPLQNEWQATETEIAILGRYLRLKGVRIDNKEIIQ